MGHAWDMRGATRRIAPASDLVSDSVPDPGARHALAPRSPIAGASFLFTAPLRLRHIRVQHAACKPRTCCMHAAHMLTRSGAYATLSHTAMPAHDRREMEEQGSTAYSTACARHARGMRESSRLIAPAPDPVSDRKSDSVPEPTLDPRSPFPFSGGAALVTI